MRIKLNYLDNYLDFLDGEVINVECENKNCFYRLVKSFNNLSKGFFEDDLVCFDNENEVDLTNSIQVYIDYFNMDFDNKKYQTRILELVQKNIDEETSISINNNLKKINKMFSKEFGDIDIPLIMEDITINSLFKQIKFNINMGNDVLQNLITIVDIEKTFNINKLLVFVNLKQYLSKEELEEFYKYAVYNQIKVLLIDSQSYGVANNYEKKLLIDSDLVEFVL